MRSISIVRFLHTHLVGKVPLVNAFLTGWAECDRNIGEGIYDFQADNMWSHH